MTQIKFSSHPIKAPNNRHGFSLAGLVGILALAMAMSAQIAPRPALAAISDVPLYLTSPVEPNIMFVIDDSGSMHYELMPDELRFENARFAFPRASEVYGSNDYANTVATIDNNPYNALQRSPQINTLYYNPGITYKPWVKHDNTLYPNATPASAYHNPEKTSAGSRDLTANNTNNATWIACSSANTCTTNTDDKTFWPATYFWHKGGDKWIWGSYDKVEIKSTTASYSGHGRENRADCTGGTCSYEQEIQNFANWYTYYRSRILAARAGIGRAFAQQGEDVRVGFGAINYTETEVDGVSKGTVVRGVRKFTAGTNRQNFFSDLYTRDIPASGTPLRRALNRVGQYYSSTDNDGPWGASPGDNIATAHLECRQSYTVLMTDGYWSGGDSYRASTSAARENVDGTSSPAITGPGSASFTYSAVSPFTDGHENTLADVAMYYWKRDLRSDLVNEVPTSEINPAFWQHMVTFGVGLGVTASVNPTDAFNAIDSGATITWPYTEPDTVNCGDSDNSDEVCPARIDDLLHASVNGRGGFFSASDPNTFATELSNVLNSITDRTSSSSAVASNSTRLTSSTHLYQALFKSGEWSGQLKAFPLLADGSIGPEAWDAADGIPAHGSRNIKTWDDTATAGMDFLGALGSLTAAQVNYLRGDDTNEVSNGGTLRNRSGKLGDIINSDPHYVKNENFGYNTLPGDEGLSYSAFVLGKNDRTAMIYAGANDGMLHGFNASFVWQDSDSAVDSDGDGDLTNDHDVYVQSPNAGKEVFAYVPNAVWPNLPLLTDPAYTHKYFVDGSPTAWDAYWATSWKTVLVGSLGAGGEAVYALDVSNPDTFGNLNVLWEFTHADLGHVMGSATVARFADGNYWAVFGNGYGSANCKSGLFMVQIDAPSNVKFFDTEVGDCTTSATQNGMSTPVLIDENGDRIVDRIYAGDLKGNVWRIDVTGAISTWKFKYAASGNPAPLFQAKDSSGNVQPITSAPEVGLAPSGASGLMVYFGTGKYFETGDELTKTVQSMYGIVDSGSAFGKTGNNRDQLVLQSIVYEGTVGGNDVRVMSNNTVSYPGDKGWVIDLLTPPSTANGERVITAPVLFGGKLLFQTIIPSLSPCDYGGASWFMSVNPSTGGQLLSASFDTNGDGLFNTNDQIDIGEGVMANASGVNSGVGISGGFGAPIKAGGTAYVPQGGTAGTLGATGISSGTLKSRASWRQIQ